MDFFHAIQNFFYTPENFHSVFLSQILKPEVNCYGKNRDMLYALCLRQRGKLEKVFFIY